MVSRSKHCGRATASGLATAASRAEAQKNPFFARVLASQKEYARKTVPHAQKMTPPMDVAVRHYWQKR